MGAQQEAGEAIKESEVEKVLDLLRMCKWRVSNEFGIVFLSSSATFPQRSRLESEQRQEVNDVIKRMSSKQFLSLLPHFSEGDRWRLRKLRKILGSED